MINSFLKERLDRKVVKALEEKTQSHNIWDYLNTLVASDLLGPEYTPEPRDRSRFDSKMVQQRKDKEVYDRWVELGTPTLYSLSEEFGVSISSVRSRIQRQIKRLEASGK